MTRYLLLCCALMLGALLFIADAPGEAQGMVRDCPASATSLRGTREPLRCRCGAGATRRGSVWGSGVYSDESSICRAALHAGVLPEDGGLVVVDPEQGRESYGASLRNGVESLRYGRRPGSFRVLRGEGSTWGGGNRPAEVCPANARDVRTRRTLRCQCVVGATQTGAVWGSDVYTDDSSICRAGLHAGVIPDSGGTVVLEALPGRASYEGVRRNGVESLRYGRWDGSFRILRGDGGVGDGGQVGANACPANARDVRTRQLIDCMCRAEDTRTGPVWGSDVYTDDSSICRAALHAGAIGPNGGAVSVRGLTGRNAYDGSRRNGVESMRYGPWESSFRFAGIGQENPDAVDRCPDNGVALRGTNRALQCRCTPEDTRTGFVWGSDTYSDDSRICRAALHAGVIGTNGGTVTVWPTEGRASYAGSRRNGVETSNYGGWPGSYRFGR